MRALLGMFCFLSLAVDATGSEADGPAQSQRRAEVVGLLTEISSRRTGGDADELPADLAAVVDAWVGRREAERA
jgi:hypothetical protein